MKHAVNAGHTNRLPLPVQVLVPLLVPLLVALAALVNSARGGLIIENGVSRPMPWTDRFVSALFEFAWWVPVGVLLVLAIQRLSRMSRPLVIRTMELLVLASMAVVAYFFLRAGVRLPGDPVRIGMSLRGFLSILPASIGMVLIISLVSALLVAQERSGQRARVAADLALRTSQLETQLAEARLGALRAQLHPHFLFNALHAISTLTEIDPRGAQRMLTQLGELLRMAVAFSEEREITVAREVEWLEHYLDLQMLRFGDRLSTHLYVSGEVLHALVPPLILQPLVENAVKYAVEPNAGNTRIEVSAMRDGNRLRLVVRDSGAREAPGATVRGSGIGLRNTRERLDAIHGDDHRIHLHLDPNGGAASVVEVPWRTSIESLRAAGVEPANERIAG